MSYDIYIGEAEFGQYESGEIYARVNNIFRDDAPDFSNDFMSKNGNSRHPGYSAWSEWAEEVELHDLFFNKESGLMSSHPGCFALKTDHLEIIQGALLRYRDAHPDAVPGFARWDFAGDNKEPDPDANKDPILARLVWLEYWVRYAVENCKTPAIYNS